MNELLTVTVGTWQSPRLIRIFGSYLLLEVVRRDCGVCPTCLERVADTGHALKKKGVDYDFTKFTHGGADVWAIRLELKNIKGVSSALKYLSEAIGLPVTLKT